MRENMPAGKSLNDLIKSIIEEEERKMREIMEEIEAEIEREFRDYEIPLYAVYEEPEEYDYLVDIPYLDLNSISIKRMKNFVIFIFRNKKGKKYLLKIRLPYDADENSISYYVVKSYIKIILKRKS